MSAVMTTVLTIQVASILTAHVIGQTSANNARENALLTLMAGSGSEWIRIQIPLLVLAFVVGVVLGVLITNMVRRIGEKNKIKNAMPRYPRDWPKDHEIFVKHESQKGYFKTTGRQVVENKKYAGAVRLGRLYPKREWFKLIPEDVWPFSRLREAVIRWTAPEVWIPYKRRFEHFAIFGSTGGGKSTGWAIPTLAYGAFEENTSYLAIDVKSPELVRLFSRLYKNARKEILFFDPWSPDETLAFEPIWRANPTLLNQLAETITTYSSSGTKVEHSGNSEFFAEAAKRVMRGLLELAQFWPRRFCNLPCIQQLVAAGFEKVQQAFQYAPSLLPQADEVVRAAKKVVEATEEELRRLPRSEDPELSAALEVLDRAGYVTAVLVRQMRDYHARHRNGIVSDTEYTRAWEEFEIELREECERRKQQLEKLIESQGEFLDMPDETKGSVMSTLTNKIAYFSDENIAKAFSRDELDLRALIERPCLMLIGAPLAMREIGSMFVGSILTNLSIAWVFERGAAIQRGVKGVWEGGVFFLLDEFPQLNVRNASMILATFRGFKAGLQIIYQDRGQLKTLYKEDVTNVEANLVNQAMLPGAHPETCEHYIKSIGEVLIPKKSESSVEGESKKNVSVSFERVRRLEPSDLHDGRLNGEIKKKIAFSVGHLTPAFPIMPVPFWEDPFLRKVLAMQRRVAKNNPKWKFWSWKDEWVTVVDENAKYIVRRKRDRHNPEKDPVRLRLEDPYGQYVEYLIGKPKERVRKRRDTGVRLNPNDPIYDENGKPLPIVEMVEPVFDELVVPRLDLAAVTGSAGGRGGGGFPGMMPTASPFGANAFPGGVPGGFGGSGLPGIPLGSLMSAKPFGAPPTGMGRSWPLAPVPTPALADKSDQSSSPPVASTSQAIGAPASLIPIYGSDIKMLVKREWDRRSDPLMPTTPAAGTIEDRISNTDEQ